MNFYMYWLATLHAIGSRKQNQLLTYFGSAKTAYEAPPDVYRSLPGFTENHIRTIFNNRDRANLEYGMEMLEKRKISFTYLGHDRYPSWLNEIPDPPVGLFFLGMLPPSDMPHVAIIGSRRCSEYGLNTARRFGSALARNDVTIVSGMARGIDSEAHRGALETGLTAAVLGCGVDICYPAENRQLRDEIAEKGCVLSEYPPGVGPRAQHFPARNRIISGLSQIIVVIESGKKSGTLITVDQALEQGRDVMALPGNITNKYSEGTNSLIKQGAEPVCNYEDVLHMLGMDSNKKVQNNSKPRPDIATDEKLVYDSLASRPSTLDEIMIKTKGKAQTVQYVLTMLELKGYVKKLPGMRYIKV